MFESRRQLLLTLASAASVVAGSSLLVGAQSPVTPRPSPNAPDPNSPHRIGDPEPTVDSDRKGIDKQNQAEIRLEVQKLSDLVGELKEQLDHTDSTSTLSLSFVKKAQQIEKLAKQIKDRAKS
jgi:hypothetical protein